MKITINTSLEDNKMIKLRINNNQQGGIGF